MCVGNGGGPGPVPEGVSVLTLPENVGIPAGRNRGADRVSGEWVFFLDDPLLADRALLVVLLPLSILALGGHFVAIMASRRVRS